MNDYTSAELVEASHASVHERRAEEAIEAARRAHVLEPRDANLLAHLGQLLRQAGRNAEAERVFNEALALAPSAGLHEALSQALLGQGRVADAVEPAQQALALRPDAAPLCEHLGNLLVRTERYAEAERVVRTGLGRAATPGLWGVLSHALAAQGSHGEAITAAQQALNLQPEQPRLLGHLADLLRREERHAEAEEALRRALALAPSAGLHAALSHVLTALGRSGEAAEAARRSVALWPDHPPLHGHLASLLMRTGKYAESEVSSRAAIALAPANPGYHFLLCQALANQHRLADAVGAARRAAELAPANVEYRKKLSELLILHGVVDEGEAELRAATALAPSDRALQTQLDELVAWKATLASHRERLGSPELTGRSSASTARAKVAVCVIVKNEAESILEWMAFHKCIGFDALIVVDDGSTDGTPDIVARMGRDHDVRLSRYREERDRQAKAYETICAEYRNEFDWIAFIDADEFIVPSLGDDIHELLDRAGDHAAIALPWVIFGSSGNVEKPRQPIVEAFRRRAPDQFGPNRHVKSIVRPARVIAGVNAHCFAVDGSYCGPDGGPLLWQQPGILRTSPQLNDWRVQHYFTRSMAHWQERMQRGQLSRLTRTMEMFFEYDRNELLDEAALRFLPSVRRVMRTYAQLSD